MADTRDDAPVLVGMEWDLIRAFGSGGDPWDPYFETLDTDQTYARQVSEIVPELGPLVITYRRDTGMFKLSQVLKPIDVACGKGITKVIEAWPRGGRPEGVERIHRNLKTWRFAKAHAMQMDRDRFRAIEEESIERKRRAEHVIRTQMVPSDWDSPEARRLRFHGAALPPKTEEKKDIVRDVKAKISGKVQVFT